MYAFWHIHIMLTYVYTHCHTMHSHPLHCKGVNCFFTNSGFIFVWYQTHALSKSWACHEILKSPHLIYLVFIFQKSFFFSFVRFLLFFSSMYNSFFLSHKLQKCLGTLDSLVMCNRSCLEREFQFSVKIWIQLTLSQQFSSEVIIYMIM